MSNFFEHENYLRLDAEIELNTIATDLELMMAINEKDMNNYSQKACFAKVCELMSYIFMLQELSNKAIAHNLCEVYDKCNHYILETEKQMTQLREKYI